jgi:hypothetical protein
MSVPTLESRQEAAAAAGGEEEKSYVALEGTFEDQLFSHWVQPRLCAKSFEMGEEREI